MSERREELIPALGVVTEIRKDTPDVKTFRVVTPDGKKAFEHKPGQCASFPFQWCRRGYVFYYLFSDTGRIYGVFH